MKTTAKVQAYADNNGKAPNQYTKAIDWALSQEYQLSVHDYSEPGEYDCKYSTDRQAIIDCIEGTELPNVEIHNKHSQYLLTFSVIIDGNPDEYINDYTMPNERADRWRQRAAQQFEKAIYA